MSHQEREYLDAIIAERDEWKHKADSWRKIEEDTLERLGTAEAEVARLREALTEISARGFSYQDRHAARAALAPKEDA
jgi:hypothetical protein